MKTVHLIFKTHLDFGFTDFAASVFQRYVDRFIPQALARAKEMRESGQPERFVWTTGSWLVYEYLEQANTDSRRRMEEAIAAGDIAWHALPYTTHTELMDPSLFRFSLTLAKELDRRFGRHTIAAKMTDVPGHCRAIVPMLAEAGVTFLHLGVNPACPPPRVPPMFRWQSPDGSEIVVAYSTDYGSPLQMKGQDDALVFAHTGDNCGPPPAEGIRRDFDQWRAAYPGANVVASTLDAYAAALLPHRAALPVVTSEIGDTWIHGTATDPRKTVGFRALCRLRVEWEKSGTAQKHAAEFRACSRFLLNVAEHTWGMDEKTHLGDYLNYSPAQFAAARKRDLVPASSVPPEFKAFAPFKANSQNLDNSPRPQRYSTFVASWEEQRGYIRSAVRALGKTPLAAEAKRELRRLKPVRPDPKRLAPFWPTGLSMLGMFLAKIDYATGAIIHLELPDGRSFCDSRHPLALFLHQTFSAEDYASYFRLYARDVDKHRAWIIPDLTKPGIENVRPRPKSAFLPPKLARLRERYKGGADEVLAVIAMPAAACNQGAPRTVFLRYTFSRTEPKIDIELSWFDKTATRLPEALWLTFAPKVAPAKGWEMDKMGEWFSPLEVVAKGNRYLHGINREIRHRGPAGTFTIASPDAHLVSPGAPRLLIFDQVQPPLSGGMHFNLYNNIWGTNFPMWSDDDARFRFTITMG